MREQRSRQGGGARGSPGGSPERRRAHALTDTGLLEAMRAGDPWAWGEFVARFQPLLHTFARRIGVPAEDRDECIDEVLADEALRFTESAARPPEQLGAYLMRAVRHKYLRLRRGRSRRLRHYADAADETTTGSPEAVVRSACSAHALRVVREPEPAAEANDATAVGTAIARLAAALDGVLTPEEEQLLAWHGEQVPHREIAQWLGVSYDAATKRIWRLCRKARALADDVVRKLPPADQAALASVFGRSRRPAVARSEGTGTDGMGRSDGTDRKASHE